MTRILVLFSLFVCVRLGAQAQESPRSFEILNKNEVPNMPDYVRALENTFLDKYRQLDSRTIMRFADGVTVQLLSGKEMEALGMRVNMSVLNSVPINDIKFTLHSSGRIIKWTPPQTTKQ